MGGALALAQKKVSVTSCGTRKSLPPPFDVASLTPDALSLQVYTRRLALAPPDARVADSRMDRQNAQASSGYCMPCVLPATWEVRWRSLRKKFLSRLAVRANRCLLRSTWHL